MHTLLREKLRTKWSRLPKSRLLQLRRLTERQARRLKITLLQQRRLHSRLPKRRLLRTRRLMQGRGSRLMRTRQRLTSSLKSRLLLRRKLVTRRMQSIRNIGKIWIWSVLMEWHKLSCDFWPMSPVHRTFCSCRDIQCCDGGTMVLCPAFLR